MLEMAAFTKQGKSRLRHVAGLRLLLPDKPGHAISTTRETCFVVVAVLSSDGYDASRIVSPESGLPMHVGIASGEGTAAHRRRSSCSTSTHPGRRA
jgi:hypothetical protein